MKMLSLLVLPVIASTNNVEAFFLPCKEVLLTKTVASYHEVCFLPQWYFIIISISSKYKLMSYDSFGNFYFWGKSLSFFVSFASINRLAIIIIAAMRTFANKLSRGFWLWSKVSLWCFDSIQSWSCIHCKARLCFRKLSKGAQRSFVWCLVTTH